MATPRGGYFNAAGERIPGTTTIISRFKESGGLVHWAWNLGREGKDYRAERDAAADAGTLAHDMVEAWIHGADHQPGDNYPDEVVEKALTAFGAFREWARQTELKVTHTEVSMVSEQHQFGGTLDAMLVNGQLALGDWKTSNALYADYLYQLAAYGLLWEEHHPDQPITGGFHLVRFSKNDADFEHRYFADLSVAREGFLTMRKLYDIDKQLRKRVR